MLFIHETKFYRKGNVQWIQEGYWWYLSSAVSLVEAVLLVAHNISQFQLEFLYCKAHHPQKPGPHLSSWLCSGYCPRQKIKGWVIITKSWGTRNPKLQLSIWITFSSRYDLHCSLKNSRVIGIYVIPLPSFLVWDEMSLSIPRRSIGEGIFKCKCQTQQEGASSANPKYS